MVGRFPLFLATIWKKWLYIFNPYSMINLISELVLFIKFFFVRWLALTVKKLGKCHLFSFKNTVNQIYKFMQPTFQVIRRLPTFIKRLLSSSALGNIWFFPCIRRGKTTETAEDWICFMWTKVKFRMKRKSVAVETNWTTTKRPLLPPSKLPVPLLMASSPWPCTEPAIVRSLGCWTRSVSRSLLLPPPLPSLPCDSADDRGGFDCCESANGGQEVAWCVWVCMKKTSTFDDDALLPA